MEGDEEEEEPETQEKEEEEELEMEAKILQLPLRSKEGLTSNKSFKVWGEIQHRPVLISVDSGATSNFISQGLVRELELKVEGTPGYMIEVAMGEKVSNEGVCKGVRMRVQGVDIKQFFFYNGVRRY